MQIPFFLPHILITTITVLSLGEYSGKKFQLNDHSLNFFFPPKKREMESECIFRHNYDDFKLHFRITKMENNSFLGFFVLFCLLLLCCFFFFFFFFAL